MCLKVQRCINMKMVMMAFSMSVRENPLCFMMIMFGSFFIRDIGDHDQLKLHLKNSEKTRRSLAVILQHCRLPRNEGEGAKSHSRKRARDEAHP